MNCNELKQLISETEDLAGLGLTPEASDHLKACSDCRAKLAFEGKLRKGFAGIASEAAPPDLAAKIMAIQAEQLAETGARQHAERPGWLASLLLSLQGFPFKVAFAAGFTGFLAAVLILRQPQAVPVSEPTAVATRQRQEIPAAAPAQEETPTLAKSDSKSLSIQSDKAKLPGTSAEADSNATDNDRMQLAMTTERRRANKSDDLEISEPASKEKEERIPGAITFTLDSSADTFVAEQSAAGAPALADQFAASEAEIQLAMSPEDRESISAPMPSAPTRFAAPPAELQPRIAASQVAKEASGGKMELKKSAAAAQNGEELLELIETNAIDMPEGFINLEELAMRGYLPSEKLRRLRPPTGSGWYLQKSGGKPRIFLKKR